LYHVGLPRSSLTNGKNMVGLVSFPHQFAMYELVIHVEPAKPARPKAAGGAIGWRKICTLGVCPRVFSTLASSPWW
jgi:hypothetical protein